MGHRQDMTPNQRFEWDCSNYKKRLEAKKGHNYEYWTSKHNLLLEKGWSLFLITEKSTRQWGKMYKQHSTSSEYLAKKIVDELRESGNYARIICGYEKTIQRTKMYSIIFKPKP
jgi:hypothetical protein